MQIRVVLFAIGACLIGSAPLEAQVPIRSMEVLSETYTIDRKYKSMEGPQSTRDVILLASDTPELLWITGYEAVMVGPDGTTPARQEFMCHSNLDFNVGQHNVLFGSTKPMSPRLFTLSQGQLTIRFPEGFGIPILSNEPLSLTTQVLNHNIEHEIFQVRHKVTTWFVRDRDLQEPLQPLFPSSAYGLALLEGHDAYFGIDQPNEVQHGSSCLIGANASQSTYRDAFGRTFTGHWVVKPGREVNRTLVTKLMNLPFDTTIHSIAVHLHPFAESLELRDLTTGKTLFKSRARNFRDRIGLDHVDDFSSQKGLQVFKNHDYELVSVYHNTTPVNQDSMAVMYLYLLDKEFHKPSVQPRAEEPTPTPSAP